MPLRIGNQNVAGLKIAGETVGGMKIGTELIYQVETGVSFQTTMGNYSRGRGFRTWTESYSSDSIPAALKNNASDQLFLRQLVIFDDGRVRLDVRSSDGSAADLSSDWESRGRLRVVVGSLDREFAVSADTASPYEWPAGTIPTGDVAAITGGDATVTISVGSAPAPSGARHSFTIAAGSQGGYNGPGGNGSITSGGASYSTPDGTQRTIQHCRPVRGIVNFALSGGNVPVAQFPGRIVATAGSNTVTLSRPSSVRNISGGTITRGDYTVSAGTLGDVFADGNTITVQLFDS